MAGWLFGTPDMSTDSTAVFRLTTIRNGPLSPAINSNDPALTSSSRLRRSEPDREMAG
jgi:hypothetical protein